jgi:predicted nuclease of predicted toxin-antitoxin system
MSYAADHGCVVLTHDLDFGAILAGTRGERPSVVQIRNHDVSVENLGQKVIAALRHLSSELEPGALLNIEVERTRIRRLPYGPSS